LNESYVKTWNNQFEGFGDPKEILESLVTKVSVALLLEFDKIFASIQTLKDSSLVILLSFILRVGLD
jgi:hypothetical protein